jgi:hypothetical protein
MMVGNDADAVMLQEGAEALVNLRTIVTGGIAIASQQSQPGTGRS